MNKKAILLIHGLAGSPNDFGYLINDLKEKYDVYYFTLPGHNKKRIINVTKDDWINKSEEVLKKIINKNYKEIYLIGHSMGGVISVYLAAKYKEITKLILAAPAYKYKDKKEFNITEGIKTLKTMIKDYPLKKIINNIIKIPKKSLQEFTSLVIEHQKDINKIKCPTLILWGKEDKIVTKDTINYVYNNIKSKSVILVKINNIAHSLFINNRYKEVKNIIINFLNKENINIKKETSI